MTEKKYVLLNGSNIPRGIFDLPHDAGYYLMESFPQSKVNMFHIKSVEEQTEFTQNRPTMTVSTKTTDAYAFRVEGVIPIHFTLHLVQNTQGKINGNV